MLRFLYTGATSFLGPQIDPEKSLGGFASSSIIPNRKNNLFSDTSYLSNINSVVETKAIILENFTTEENPILNVGIGYRYDDNLYNIEIGIIELNSEGKMEIIQTSKSLPYYATFSDASINEEADNSIIIPEFAANGRYGIWIKRKVKTIPIEDLRDYEEIPFKFVITRNT